MLEREKGADTDVGRRLWDVLGTFDKLKPLHEMHGQSQGLPGNSLDTGSGFEDVVETVYFSFLVNGLGSCIYFSPNKLGLQRVIEGSVCFF